MGNARPAGELFSRVAYQFHVTRGYLRRDLNRLNAGLLHRQEREICHALRYLLCHFKWNSNVNSCVNTSLAKGMSLAIV